MFTKKFLTDAAERLLKTFIQAFVAVFAVGDLSTAKAAVAAGVAAALSAVSSILSTQLGEKGTASAVD